MYNPKYLQVGHLSREWVTLRLNVRLKGSVDR